MNLPRLHNDPVGRTGIWTRSGMDFSIGLA